MNDFLKIAAAGVLSLSFTHPAIAQAVVPAPPESPAAAGKSKPPKEFEHPVLEKQSSTDMRRDDGPRIQRRGQETRRDGGIERNVDSGAARSSVPHGRDGTAVHQGHMPLDAGRSKDRPPTLRQQ